MKQLKAFLNKLLGKERYLQLTSHIFLLVFRAGWLRQNVAYGNHYFVRNLVGPGDTVIDIGANLGYYASELGRLVGPNGLVLAVEPIPFYRKVLLRNIGQLPQVKVLPYALGEQEGTISMGLPGTDKHRHGLMRVLRTDAEKQQVAEVIEVEVRNPLHLFAPVEKLAFIKCDIEGYEVPVIPAMMPLINQHRAIVQVETEGENKRLLHELFERHQYQMFEVKQDKLHSYAQPTAPLQGDMVAIPQEKLADLQHLIHA